MLRACKLCGGLLPDRGTRPYQDCEECERKIIKIATRLPRPAVYNDFQELRPLGQAGGRYMTAIAPLIFLLLDLYLFLMLAHVYVAMVAGFATALVVAGYWRIHNEWDKKKEKEEIDLDS